MLLLILQKELLSHILDRKFLFGMILVVFLSMVHIWVLVPDYQRALDEYDRRASAQSYQMLPPTSFRAVTAREVKVEFETRTPGCVRRGGSGEAGQDIQGQRV